MKKSSFFIEGDKSPDLSNGAKEEIPWDRKYIRSVFDWGLSDPGTHGGMRRRIIPNSSSRISGSVTI
jgi:hypothetical protein